MRTESRPTIRASLSAPRTLTLIDALAGAIERYDDYPVALGGESSSGPRLTIESRGGEICLVPGPDSPHANVNGALLTLVTPIPRDETVVIELEDRAFFLRLGGEPTWIQNLDATQWVVFDIATGTILGDCPLSEIPPLLARIGMPAEHCAACPSGLDAGIAVNRLLDILRAASIATQSGLDTTGARGKYFCPACWLRFDAGDVLSIARHEEMTGDPILGPDQRLRFHPSRFSNGMGLDPMGLPCPDLACPHCRRQLPHGYLETKHEIFSLVGAPGSGKSYLLATLTKTLADGLARDFGFALRDDDPTGNLMLNQMRNGLFSALTPEDAVLSKTALEGAFYERVRLHGRTVAMPRPFLYSVRDPNGPSASLILYDNAGEHFEPGVDSETSPGALHVAASSGVMFLFDPTSNASFRTALEGRAKDTQLTQIGRIDRQDTILAEMDVRIKRILGLSRSEKIATPLAVLIGKSDVWKPLFDARALPSPVVDGALDPAVVDANSDALRELLLRLCPDLVTSAECVSKNVRYFGVTALGHSPSLIVGGRHDGVLAPEPKKLSPHGVNHAMYWLLANGAPGVIPVKK